jgi:hypothetical protein
VFLQVVKGFRPFDVDSAPAVGKELVSGRFLLPWSQYCGRWVQLVEENPEVVQDLGRQVHGIGVLADRHAAGSQAFLEPGQVLAGDFVFCLEIDQTGAGGQAPQVGWVAQVNASRAGLVRSAQDAVLDFQLRDATSLAHLGLDPGILRQQLGVLGEISQLGHPPITFAEQAEEEWSTPIDLIEAEAQDAALLGLLLGDAPAQIDFHEGDTALLTQPPQVRKDPLDQFLAFGVHVAERRRDEDPDKA